MTDFSALISLGWQPFFQQQLSLDEWETAQPARIVEQHRSRLEVATASEHRDIPLLPSMPTLTVGDWILLDQHGVFLRALDRTSLFKRKAAGSKISEQLIAANIDTALITCSLNEDFNLNRIERYLCLVQEAGSEAVILLTKADLCADSDAFIDQIRGLDNRLTVLAMDARSHEQTNQLQPWLGSGQTVAVLGSSGVGKSTLVNQLVGEERQSTGGIREDDDKGRHTTTRRSLLTTAYGGLILDTPGMRELQLTGTEDGISATFADIEALAQQCRFGDCSHHDEPGCAVQAAIQNSQLDPRRLRNYEKLQRELALNNASLAERRQSERDTARYHKRVLKASLSIKRGE